MLLQNAGGTAMFHKITGKNNVSQNFRFTPSTLRHGKCFGSNLQEQIIKDYNGQTYWFLQTYIRSLKQSNCSKWLNVAVGYGVKE
jgi:hypothetical protein